MKAATKWRVVVYLLTLVVVLGWMFLRTLEPSPIEVRVLRDGLVQVDGQTLEVAALGERVSARLRSDPRRRVQVVVDAKSPSTVLIPVLDVLDRSGVENVQVIANP